MCLRSASHVALVMSGGGAAPAPRPGCSPRTSLSVGLRPTFVWLVHVVQFRRPGVDVHEIEGGLCLRSASLVALVMSGGGAAPTPRPGCSPRTSLSVGLRPTFVWSAPYLRVVSGSGSVLSFESPGRTSARSRATCACRGQVSSLSSFSAGPSPRAPSLWAPWVFAFPPVRATRSRATCCGLGVLLV